MLSKVIPDFLFDLQGAGGASGDMKRISLSSEGPLGEGKTKPPNSGPAHRGANGAAMPTDEDDHDYHFL